MRFRRIWLGGGSRPRCAQAVEVRDLRGVYGGVGPGDDPEPGGREQTLARVGGGL